MSFESVADNLRESFRVIAASRLSGDLRELNGVSIASAGAELNLTLGVLSWDTPYRFRLGIVSPQHNAAYFGRQSVQVYVVSGISF